MCKFEPDHDLYRGVHPSWWSHKDNRPSSLAFNHTEMSVDWCVFSTSTQSFFRYMKQAGLSNGALASFKVAEAQLLHQKVKYDPVEIEGEYNPAHTLVIGNKPKKTVARRFAKEFAKVVFPLK